MTIREELSTEVKYDCDVLVVGGGFAGIAAAMAAAEEGKKVILAERVFLLGGLGTAGLVTIFLPLCDGCGKQVSFGLAERLLKLSVEHHHYETRGYPNWIGAPDREKQKETDPRYEVSFNPSLFAISAEQALLARGVTILYGTVAVGAKTENQKICAVIFENKSGRFAVRAKSFVDASGDADLAKFSGAPTALYGKGNILAAWYYTNQDEKYSLKMLGYAEIPDSEKQKGKKTSYLSDRRFTGVDGEEISQFMQLSHASTLNDYQKQKESDPALEPTTIATIPQLRMTRRIVGEYALDESEVHTSFTDSVGMVSDWRKRGPVFEIPFRTLYSSAVKNLVFAGRCTSVTDTMWDIMRVIPCCCVTGEAAGVAAAMSDDFSVLDVSALQSRLCARGVVLHESDL